MTKAEYLRLKERASKLREMGALTPRVVPTFDPGGPELTLQFGNHEAARHFKNWLCGAGEQDYWQWMEIRETEQDGPITGVKFDYHRKHLISVACGRLLAELEDDVE